MSRDKNYRQRAPGGSQLPLEFHAAEARNPDVKHETTRPARLIGFKECLGGLVSLDVQSDRLDQLDYQADHSRIIVHDINDWGFDQGASSNNR
jgi:hypothetical protein